MALRDSPFSHSVIFPDGSVGDVAKAPEVPEDVTTPGQAPAMDTDGLKKAVIGILLANRQDVTPESVTSALAEAQKVVAHWMK